MTNDEWIELFFSEAYEKQINELVLEDRDYEIPYDSIYKYVKQIIGIPYTEFLDFVKEYGNVSYNKRDVPQYINFSHCENAMIRLLIREDNTGLTPSEIGELLCKHDNWSSRGYVYYANRHLISAKILGIVFEYFGHWYLNCIGYVYPNLEPRQQKSLLARTLLRSPLFKSIIARNPKQISLLDLVHVLPYNFIKNNYIAITSFIGICITEAHDWGRIIHFDDHLFGRVLFRDIFNYKALQKKSSSLSYSIYLNEVMSYYDMEEKEALQLYYRYKNGDRHALEEIVKTAQSIVIRIASSYQFAPFEDILQEGNIGLLEGIEYYDPQKYRSLYGYLSFWVKRRIQTCQYEISSLIHIPISVWQSIEIMKESFDRYVQKTSVIPSVNDLDIEEEINSKNMQSLYNLLDILPDMICRVDDLDIFTNQMNTIEEFENYEEYRNQVQIALRRLKPRERLIIKSYYGIDVKQEIMETIGHQLHLTRERVRQIIENSITKMRESSSFEVEEYKIGDEVCIMDSYQVGKIIEIRISKTGNNRYVLKMKKGNKVEVTDDDIYCKATNGTSRLITILERQAIAASSKQESTNESVKEEEAKTTKRIQSSKSKYINKVGQRKEQGNKQNSSSNKDNQHQEERAVNKNETPNSKDNSSEESKPVKKKVQVGDTIKYNSRVAIVRAIRNSIPHERLILKYPDGTVDNVINDTDRYTILESTPNNTNKPYHGEKKNIRQHGES